MRRSWWLGGVSLLTLLGAYVFGVAPRWLRVERVRLATPGLPPDWRGVRIAHLTDFHMGATGVGLSLLLRARQAAIDFEPDVIALTGDYYRDGQPVPAPGLYAAWPARTRVFAVLGNHDYRSGDVALASVLRELVDGGARVLRDEAVEVELRGATAWIVGVEDPFTLRADERGAFAQLPADAEALLFLAHSPAGADAMPLGRARIVLSGHTHGGQLRVLPSGRTPGVGLLRRLTGTGPRREPSVFRGRQWVRGAALIISDGLGLSQLPARFRTRPTVLLIELDVAPSTGAACDDIARYARVENPLRWWERWFT